MLKNKTLTVPDHQKSDAKELRCALAKIAKEIIRFNKNETNFNNNNNENDLNNKLRMYKIKSKHKKRKIKKMRQSLRISWVVLKVLLSSKTIKKKDKIILLDSLQNEDSVKKNEINDILEVINKAYEKISKLQQQASSKLSTINKLQNIIFYGHYNWENFCNERVKNLLYEQKIRFLNIKIKILENYLKSYASASNGFPTSVNLQNQVQTKHQINDLNNVSTLCPIKIKSSDKLLQSKSTSTMISKHVTPHLRLMKNLITDQYCLIEDLKKLSEQCSTTESESLDASLENNYKNLTNRT